MVACDNIINIDWLIKQYDRLDVEDSNFRDHFAHVALFEIDTLLQGDSEDKAIEGGALCETHCV